jgi:hypothetical protein
VGAVPRSGRSPHRTAVAAFAATVAARGAVVQHRRERVQVGVAVVVPISAADEDGVVFLGWAQVWRAKARDEFLRQMVEQVRIWSAERPVGLCQRRGLCPSCAAKRGALFSVLLGEEVLADMGHLVWTERHRHPATLAVPSTTRSDRVQVRMPTQEVALVWITRLSRAADRDRRWRPT